MLGSNSLLQLLLTWLTREKKTMRATSLFVVLLIFWLLLSGVYKPFLIGSGLAIAVASVYLARRMEVIDHEGHPIDHAFRTILMYWPWLIKEICISALKVSKTILQPKLEINPKMELVELSQKTDLGRTVFANSITLTPGTIAVEINKNTVLVHALSEDGITDLNEGEMDSRVRKLE